jgi:cytochrome c-type biogenesis protein CcmH/NrfG
MASTHFDAALEVVDPRVEPIKNDGALQFGRLERALFDGAHEDARAAIPEQLNAELAAPPRQALRWWDLGQIRIYLQGGHACHSTRFLLIARRILIAAASSHHALARPSHGVFAHWRSERTIEIV